MTAESSIVNKILSHFYKIKRDMNINGPLYISTILQSLFDLIFAFILIKEIINNYAQELVYLTLGVVIFSMILGGILVDYVIHFQILQFILDFILIVLVYLNWLIFPGNFLLFAFLIVFFSITINLTIVLYISQTTMLNRGRYGIITMISLTIMFLPLFFFMIFVNVDYLIPILSVTTIFILIFFWERKFPIPADIFKLYSSKFKAKVLEITPVIEEIFDKLKNKMHHEKEIQVKDFSIMDESDNLSTKKSLNNLNEDKTEKNYNNLSENKSHIEETKEKIRRKLIKAVVTKHAIKQILKEWFNNLLESGIVLILIITFIFCFILGFNVNLFDVITIQDPVLIGTTIFLSVFCVVISGLIIDFIGRKPVAFITAFLMSLFAIFSDIFKADWYNLMWLFLFPIVISFSLMFLLGIIGDLSENFRKGTIISLVFIVSLIGITFGIEIEIVFRIFPDLLIFNKEVIYADLMSLGVVIILILLNYTPESFDHTAFHWRNYMDRLVIVLKSGINLYYIDFNKILQEKNSKLQEKNSKTTQMKKNKLEKSEADLDSDLISGGLSGVQSLLKEISQSKSNLQILDHSDRKFIFAHGKYTTSVLITTKLLEVLRIKLLKFQSEFEDKYVDILKNFNGNTSMFKDLDRLVEKYFDVQEKRKIIEI